MTAGSADRSWPSVAPDPHRLRTLARRMTSTPPPPPPPPPVLAPTVHAPDPGRVRSLGTWTTRLLYAATAVATARALVGLAMAGRRADFVAAFLPSLEPSAGGAAPTAGIGYSLLQGIWWACAITFVWWLWTAYESVQSTGGRPRRRAYWLVLGWIVPIANLIVPKQLVDDIWRLAEPLDRDAPPPPGPRPPDRSVVVPPPVHLWWAAWVTSGIVGSIAVAYWATAGVLEMLGEPVSPNVDLMYAGLVGGDLLTIAAGLLGAWTVARLTERVTDHRPARSRPSPSAFG